MECTELVDGGSIAAEGWTRHADGSALHYIVSESLKSTAINMACLKGFSPSNIPEYHVEISTAGSLYSRSDSVCSL